MKNPLNIHYWSARDLMSRLAYKSWSSFRHLVDEAVATMILLGIPFHHNVFHKDLPFGSREVEDFQLSRFACFLIVMNADPKKEAVADAQARFSLQAEKSGLFAKDLFEIERMKIRGELGELTKWLTKIAGSLGVKDFATFNDAGYQGLYNMHARQVHDIRNLPKNANQQEFMGSTEMAANLLRVSLTEHEIWGKHKTGQVPLEIIHYEIGKDIRGLIKKHTGKYPEDLPVYRKLSDVKKKIKHAYQVMLEKDEIKTKTPQLQ